MIDNDLRVRRMQQEANDSGTAVIMLDVVIGYGAHENPAAELGEAIREIQDELKKEKRCIAFITSITGTEGDPQGLSASAKQLEDAGVIVCHSNAQAARLAAALVEGG
jgi:FdrA protein